MSAEGTLDLRVFLFGDDHEDIRATARAFLEATQMAAPEGVSVRGSRLYRRLPPGLTLDLHAEINLILKEAA
jgi:hypothetical protein